MIRRPYSFGEALFSNKTLALGWRILGPVALPFVLVILALSAFPPLRPGTLPLLFVFAFLSIVVFQIPSEVDDLKPSGWWMIGFVVRSLARLAVPALWIAFAFGLPVILLATSFMMWRVASEGIADVLHSFAIAVVPLLLGAAVTPFIWGRKDGGLAALHVFTGLVAGLAATLILKLPRLRDLPPQDTIAIGTLLVAMFTLLPLAVAALGWAIRCTAARARLATRGPVADALLWLGGLVAVAAVAGIVFLFATDRVYGGIWQERIGGRLGSAEDAYALAWRYRNGRGVPADFGRHLAWLQQAALFGSARAQFDLGTCFYHGIGVSQDFARARALFTQATAGEFAAAETMLGLIAMDNDHDAAAAIKRWRHAAAHRDYWAEYLLGAAYLQQRAEDTGDLSLALFWLERARLHGIEPAKGLLNQVWATVPDHNYEQIQDWVFKELENAEKEP